MLTIMTRRQAAEAGLKRYYTGKPCVKDHDAQRFTSTGACVKCAAGYVKEYNGKLRQQTDAIAKGQFFYPSHPDDVAAALAYCQALDLQRGRTPWTPPVVETLKMPTVADLDAARVHAFGDAGRRKIA